jgi:hypothetical protein
VRNPVSVDSEPSRRRTRERQAIVEDDGVSSYIAPALETAEARILDGLNPAQREAVVHGEGPLPIIAGAGTDKMTVLTRRHPWSTRSDISAAAFSVKVSARISSGRARLVTMRCPTRTATCSRIGCGRNPRVWLSHNLL